MTRFSALPECHGEQRHEAPPTDAVAANFPRRSFRRAGAEQFAVLPMVLDAVGHEGRHRGARPRHMPREANQSAARDVAFWQHVDSFGTDVLKRASQPVRGMTPESACMRVSLRDAVRADHQRRNSMPSCRQGSPNAKASEPRCCHAKLAMTTPGT